MTFLDGASVIGTATLTDGVAQFDTASLGIGAHSIQAFYGASGDYLGSDSTAVSFTLERDASATSIIASANPSPAKQTLTLTAALTAAAPGSGTPTGTATFYDGKNKIGTVRIASGDAILTTKKLAVGAHKISVHYAGNSDFAASVSPVLNERIKKATKAKKAKTKANLSASPNSKRSRSNALDSLRAVARLRVHDLALERAFAAEPVRTFRLNGLARFGDSTPRGEANVHAARREPRPPGITKGHFGDASDHGSVTRDLG